MNLEIKYIAPTSIQLKQVNTLAKAIAINIFPGSISFTLEKAGSFSASLYSLSGKKVAVLFNNHILAENKTYTSLAPLNNLSNGSYVLKCEVRNSEGLMSIEKRIVFTN